MRYVIYRWIPKVLPLIVLAGLFALVGCDLLDQTAAGDNPPEANSVQAVLTAQVDDPLVNRGLNPDLRPPLTYDFNATESRGRSGDRIRKPQEEVAWDFGDGESRGFEWNDYETHHRYWEEGTYTATLTVREAAGEASDTDQKTITIGPAWLEIINLTAEDRPDGQVNVTVVVRNQSRQALGRIQVDLVVDRAIWPSTLVHDFSDESPDRLQPGQLYTLRSTVGKWTGAIRARSSFCVPVG